MYRTGRPLVAYQLAGFVCRHRWKEGAHTESRVEEGLRAEPRKQRLLGYRGPKVTHERMLQLSEALCRVAVATWGALPGPEETSSPQKLLW